MFRAATLAALSVLALPARAQEPPTGIAVIPEAQVMTGGTAGHFEAPNDVDSFEVFLHQGDDYSFGVVGGKMVSGWVLKGPTGTVLCDWGSGEDQDGGCERRAGRDGWFILEGKASFPNGDPYPDPYTVRVTSDCKASINTRCRIAPGQTKTWAAGYGFDLDWIKLANLTIGRRYTLILDAPSSREVIFDVRTGSGGLALSPGAFTYSFRASDKTRFVRVGTDDGFGPYVYKLTLKRG